MFLSKLNEYRIVSLTIPEILLFVYLASSEFWIPSVFSDVLHPIPTGRLIFTMIMLPAMTIIIVVFTQYRLGKNDFRSKITAHVFPAIVAILFMGQSLATVSATTEAIGTEATLANQLFLKVRLLLIPVGLIYIILFLNEMFKLSDPYIDEFDTLNESYKAGQVSARIDDETVVNDSVYGKITTFVNEILDLVEVNLREMVDISILINTSSQFLASSSEEVNASAEEVSSTSQSMSQAASQQAEMISASVEEMQNAGQVVAGIINQIKGNSDVIGQIALQTNILALNAGIEASRAGDYGRGFAVVAENVRRLSEESKNAAEEISDVAISIAKTLSNIFERLRVQIEDVAALSEETAASAEEVAAAAEEVTSSMEEVSSSAQVLSERSERSTGIIRRFNLKK